MTKIERKKMYPENHSKRKNLYYDFYKNKFFKKSLSQVLPQREHLLYNNLRIIVPPHEKLVKYPQYLLDPKEVYWIQDKLTLESMYETDIG